MRTTEVGGTTGESEAREPQSRARRAQLWVSSRTRRAISHFTNSAATTESKRPSHSAGPNTAASPLTSHGKPGGIAGATKSADGTG